MQVLTERNERSNDSAQVEDAPECGDVSTFGSFGRVGHHDSSLGGPQKTSTDTKQGTAENEKPGILVVIVGQNRTDVQHVAEATQT